jgi:isoleucyl-tRNA synthetase
MFQEVTARPDFVAHEEAVLRLWAETRAFEQLRAQTRGGPKWSFLDGPITANNPMGVHHAWGRTYKDLYNRFHAMLGHELRWQQGFDCQGLWVEVAVERDLGFTNKHQIEEYGVDRFVEACKQRVFHFADVISRQSQRLGYWMDWDNSYFTLSDENNYGIWGFLKLCHERGWLYRGHDVMPWCPRCGTALSEHEIATEGYAERTHLALTVGLPLQERSGEALLVWTTTPWTLPANVAAAVHPELTYVRLEPAQPTEHGWRGVWLAKDRVAALQAAGVVRGWTQAEERLGSELVGWRYRGPFDELDAQAGVEHRVVAWDEVSAEDGTGVVHIAPGAGKEDFLLGRELGLAVLAPLDENGVYLAGYDWLSGRAASGVAEDVAANLEGKGVLFGREQYTHRYPVCWRCGTDLLFRLADEWLISMDSLRHQMMDAAKEATWLPAFGLERELDWLRNMDDWMISKKRYWGLALPIYPCEHCGHVTVVGSRAELQQRAVEGWDEFDGHSPHRPWVDAVKIACEQCGATVSRVADVGNVWLDAGIVAFSTMGYYEDRERWQQWFPAHLVLESFPGQFRNWFYALLAMSTALTGHAPFRTLLGHALVKDANGEEMHKSKGNAIWFEEAAAWMGVEPLRWLFASAPLERNINFGREAVAEAARRLQPIWEVYRFFVTYANLESQLQLGDWRLEQHRSTGSLLPLDRWLLARVSKLVETARARLSAFDARGYTIEVERFADELSNWYVRRSRRRFWGSTRGGDAAQRQAAYDTLYVTLVTLARVLAPVLPFLSETLYQQLVRSVDANAPQSVHLTGFPTPLAAHDAVLDEMEVVRQVAGLGRVARKSAGVRVRQPLARMLVAGTTAAQRAALRQHETELLDELNIKALELPEAESLQQYRLKPNLRLLGPRLGALVPKLRAVLEGLQPSEAAALAHRVAAEQDVTVEVAGEALTLRPEELLVETLPLEGYAVAQDGALQVALDTTLDAALEREGWARDLVRAAQEARKAAGMALSDRVTLYLTGGPALEDVLDEWGAYLCEETLALQVVLAEPPAEVYRESVTLGGSDVLLGVGSA